MAVEFVHLRLHSEFALEDSIIRMDELLCRTAELNMPAVALTDPCNLFGMVKFYRAARSKGIKPIVGADLHMGTDPTQPTTQITLLVRDAEGYRHLIDLISRCHIESAQLPHRPLDPSWLNDRAGLLVLLGRRSDVGEALVRADRQMARQRLEVWLKLFGAEQVVLELQRTGRDGEEVMVHGAVELANELGVSVVATNDVRFLQADEFEVHETRVCIAERTTLSDPRRVRRYSEAQYLKSPEEMQALFKDIPEAISNSVRIAQRCNLHIQLGKSFLPQFPVPEGLSLEAFFCQEARRKLLQRLERLMPKGRDEDPSRFQMYQDRLEQELSIINQMGFAGYFLIVMDFIQWAKDHGVPVGPGRGSGAGSLVAYALRITDLDPTRYDLLFERFLNPERVSMPDFDIDFCMDGRDRVIEYVAQCYGREAVSQIITFGTMAAKAAVRDVARVLGKSYGLADRISKLIPLKPPGITLAQARSAEAQLELLLTQPGERDHEDAVEIWERACKLEGMIRGVGKHAGGVLIAPGKLTDFTPVFCDEDGKWVSQFDKDDVEKVGLVKFDFLGLRTLTIIDWALQSIQKVRQQKGEAPLDLELLPLDDAPTYRMIEEGRTTAVFQLESQGMKNLQRKLKPSNFEDLIALVALFRPGPLDSGMVDDFINRKHGRADVAYPDPQYQHECLQPVLAPTYGVIVYQEQVMQIAQVLAGYSLGAADLLRRAMGKKDAAEMARQRALFTEGAREKGIADTLSGPIFDLMEKFAGYGFNKSHSAAYALLSYQTAWLKLHYPAEFMAAVLRAEMHNTDALVPLIDECRQWSIVVEPPQINRSVFGFIPLQSDRILYGLGAIKGLGHGPVEAILRERQQGGPFSDLLDFCIRLDSTLINKRSLEGLIRAGCFDGLGGHRQTLFDHLDEVLNSAARLQEDRNMGVQDMFGSSMQDVPRPKIKRDERPLPTSCRLEMEREALGLYLTAHPLDGLLQELRQAGVIPLAQVEPTASGRKAKTAGKIVAWRVDRGGRGQVLLEDATGRLEVVVQPELLAEVKRCLAADAVVIVEGPVRLDRFRDAPSMMVQQLTDLDRLRRTEATRVSLRIGHEVSLAIREQLKVVLQQGAAEAEDQQGGKPVELVTEPADERLRERVRVRLLLSNRYHMVPTHALIERLRGCLGDANVEVLYE